MQKNNGKKRPNMLSKIIFIVVIWAAPYSHQNSKKTSSRLFIFVFGILLHTVGQTCLPWKGCDLEEKIRVAVNTQGHQEGSDGIKQVGCHHRPECIIWDAEGSHGAGMDRPPDVSPLALEGKTQERKQ